MTNPSRPSWVNPYTKTRTYTDTLKAIEHLMNVTGCTEDDAIAALLDTGSINEAIILVRYWMQNGAL